MQALDYSFDNLIKALYSGDYNRFAKTPMVPRDVIYTRALIEQDLGINLDYKTVHRLMHEEGMAPARDYDMPDWYRRKYGIR